MQKIKCGLLCQFSVFIAFSGNLKEMRGKEPRADWTNLGEPLGDCPGCLTQRRMTAAPANSERFGEAEGSSQTAVCQTLLHLQLGMGMNKISVIHLIGLMLHCFILIFDLKKKKSKLPKKGGERAVATVCHHFKIVKIRKYIFATVFIEAFIEVENNLILPVALILL